MKKRKWLSLLLAVMMLVSAVPFFPVTADAADGTVEVSTWAELKRALEYTTKCSVVKVVKDIETKSLNGHTGLHQDNIIFMTMAMDKVLDLNGHTVHAYAKYYSEVAQGYLISIRHKDARLTIRDSVGGGALIGEFNQEFYFQFIDVYGGTLVMESGTVKMLCPSKDNQYTKCAISVSGTAVFNGGEVLTQVTSPQGEREERYLSRRLQAIRGEKGGSVTINGGTFDRVVLHSAPTPENRGKYELVVNGGFFRQSIALILTGDVYISTCGYGITVFTDAGIEYIGKQIKGDLSDSNFAGAFDKFADLCDDFITQARTGEPYDVRNLPKEPLSLIWIPIAIVVGFVLSLIIVGRMKAKLKTVRFQAAANSYIKDGSLNITESREMFLYNTVTRTAKPKDSDSGGGSSTHTSSSGSSHGGGGGKFWYQLRPQEKAAIKNYIKGR